MIPDLLPFRFARKTIPAPRVYTRDHHKYVIQELLVHAPKNSTSASEYLYIDHPAVREPNGWAQLDAINGFP